MILCFDVGNTHILGGVFKDKKLVARFRYATHMLGTADQFGIFLLNILKFYNISPENITATAICSVVPSCDYTIQHALTLYFKSNAFILNAEVKTGLKICYTNPSEMGADRIADAIGAVEMYPQQNIIIIDMGTATTICAVTKNKDYLGGAILPGIRLGMESLKNNAAKLTEVNIEVPLNYIGKTTRESIQSGLYYGQLGTLKEIIAGYKQEIFMKEPVVVIGTGGFSQLFKDKNLFDVIVPDLVLQGLLKAYELSNSNKD